MADRELFYALHGETGVLMSRDGRPLYATKEDWYSMGKMVGRLIPAKIILFGSLPLMDTGQLDVVGAVVELIKNSTVKLDELAKADGE